MTSSKVLFVGYCPSHAGSPERPLDGPGTGHRLARLCGMSHDEYLEKFDRVNLHYETPLRRDRLTREQGEVSADRIMRSNKGRRIILLGREVLKAFNLDWMPVAQWHGSHTENSEVLDDTRIAFIPHPSGLNRWYNSAENTKLVERFLRSLD